jgi:hypothetical protein
MSFVGGKIVGRDAEARVYQAAHFGWFYIFDGLTSDSFASEQEAIAKLDRTTITGRSGGILDSIQQAFRPMIVRSMVCSRPSNLEPSEPPHTRKFALYRRVDKAPIANPTLLTITALVLILACTACHITRISKVLRCCII